MKIATCSLVSVSPYSPSRRVREKGSKESGDKYEEAIWKDRAHWNAEGKLFIPPMAFKRSIETAAKFLRIRIPGKDRSEYGKHFVAGVLVPDGLVLPITRETLERDELYLSARGKKGEMSILKFEPRIDEWAGNVAYYVLDDTITETVFEQHVREAGNFIGIGRFRPEKGGFYGRYEVKDVRWSGESS